MRPAPESYRDRIRAALDEDHAGDDATVDLLGIDANATAVVEARAEDDVVIAGIDVARDTYAQVDSGVRFTAHAEDAARLPGGSLVWRAEGPVRGLLAAERVALNLVQHLSGIATLTARFVAAAAGVTVLDTRKTTPLWRDLEKYAVRCGGGQNHRLDLSAMVLIKENHVRAVGGRDGLIARLQHLRGGSRPFVEVEVDSLDFLRALDGLLGDPIDRVMLDNFASADVPEAVACVAGAAEVEVSGGITMENIARYAQPGVDFISVGALTHSAPAAPMSVEVVT